MKALQRIVEMDVPGIRPIFGTHHQARTDGVMTNVFPLLGITSFRAQHMIEKAMLPKRRRNAKRAAHSFCSPLFPPRYKYLQSLGIFHWCRKEMHMIRHDNVASDPPAMAVIRGGPLLGKCVRGSFVRQQGAAQGKASGDEIDGMFYPHPVQTTQMGRALVSHEATLMIG